MGNSDALQDTDKPKRTKLGKISGSSVLYAELVFLGSFWQSNPTGSSSITDVNVGRKGWIILRNPPSDFKEHLGTPNASKPSVQSHEADLCTIVMRYVLLEITQYTCTSNLTSVGSKLLLQHLQPIYHISSPPMRRAPLVPN